MAVRVTDVGAVVGDAGAGHVEPSGDLTVVVGKSGVRLARGGPPYRRKMVQATRVLAELDRRGAKPGMVMLDNDARPERVVVRMR